MPAEESKEVTIPRKAYNKPELTKYKHLREVVVSRLCHAEHCATVVYGVVYWV